MLVFSIGTYCLQLSLLNRVSASIFFKRRQSAKTQQVFSFHLIIEESSAEFSLRLVGAGARTETITN